MKKDLIGALLLLVLGFCAGFILATYTLETEHIINMEFQISPTVEEPEMAGELR